jgi:hypothetical protein
MSVTERAEIPPLIHMNPEADNSIGWREADSHAYCNKTVKGFH